MSENHRLEEAIKDGVKIPEDGYWGNVPSKICGAYGGAIGGNMVKEAIESFENKLTDKNE
ncbi:alpha/beta-type small acid-soluble spore protein [Clostridium swellfunianum]|uniref:alpha/beta-type small acid-soluble spore protein n=1 Tax=Clostridium swellfunianum TaxID=1367462 RepID=UPI00202F9503|nr:alpha/beta-type small acid-soluble spore protein [Clostridium swellfunianum]